MSLEKNEFVKQPWFMWLMLIFVAPLGIYLMYKYNETFSNNKKLILSVVFSLIFLAGFMSTSLDNYGEIEVDGKYYKMQGDYETVEEYGYKDLLENLSKIGVKSIDYAPSRVINNQVELTTDKENRIVINFDEDSVIMIHKKGEEKIIYYSVDIADDIYSYPDDKLKQQGDAEAKRLKAEAKKIAEEQKEKEKLMEKLGIQVLEKANLPEEHIDSIFNVIQKIKFKKIEKVIVENGASENDILYSLLNTDGTFIFSVINNNVVEVVDEDLIKVYSNGAMTANYIYFSDIDWDRLVDYSKEIIKSALKAPKTAEFSGSWLNNKEGWKFDKNNNIVAVASYVDSQNSFGALIRSEFIIKYRYVNKTPECIYINFDGKVILDK